MGTVWPVARTPGAPNDTGPYGEQQRIVAEAHAVERQLLDAEQANERRLQEEHQDFLAGFNTRFVKPVSDALSDAEAKTATGGDDGDSVEQSLSAPTSPRSTTADDGDVDGASVTSDIPYTPPVQPSTDAFARPYNIDPNQYMSAAAAWAPN